MSDAWVSLGAAILGGLIGGAFQGIPTLLAPGREARLQDEAWLRVERKNLYTKMAIHSLATEIWLQDRQPFDDLDPSDSYAPSWTSDVQRPADVEGVQITAELRVIGTHEVLVAWDRYTAGVEDLRLALVDLDLFDLTPIRAIGPGLLESTGILLAAIRESMDPRGVMKDTEP